MLTPLLFKGKKNMFVVLTKFGGKQFLKVFSE